MGNLRRNWSLPGCAVLMVLIVPALAQTPPDEAVSKSMQEGFAQMKAGNFVQAAEAYGNVTRMQPGLAEGYFNLGLAEEKAGQLDQARTSLGRALRLKPGLRGANLFLGTIAYRQNRFKEAEGNLVAEVRLDPRSAKAFMWLGVCRLAEDNPQGAIPYLDKAHTLDPSDVDILYHRGRAYLLVANASYDAMFKLDPDSVRVHQVLGEAYAQSYRNQEAINEFELTVKIAPSQPGLHEELADQYWIVGNADKAGAAYREELRIDPSAVTAMYKLGSLLALGQGTAEGVQLLRSALRLDSTLSDAHYYLGVGLMGTDQDEDAVQEFQMAIAADPKSDRAMSAYYKLAQVYRKLHRPADAQTALKNFQQMRADVKGRQDHKSTQLVRKRTELPVEEETAEEHMPGDQ